MTVPVGRPSSVITSSIIFAVVRPRHVDRGQTVNCSFARAPTKGLHDRVGAQAVFTGYHARPGFG